MPEQEQDPAPVQPDETAEPEPDPVTPTPVLNSSWYQRNNHAATSLDPEDVPEHLVERYNTDIITQLSSFEDLFRFQAGEGSTSLAAWDKAEKVPLALRLNLVHRNHLGEHDLVQANVQDKPIIATVEPVVGGKPFLVDNLTAKGLLTSTLAEGPRFSTEFKIPEGLTDPIAVLLFICLDSNEDGRCSDERVMNLNFYLNQVNPRTVDETDVHKQLKDVFARDSKKFLQAEERPRGMVYYASRAVLDPTKKSLLGYSDFFAAAGVKYSRKKGAIALNRLMPQFKFFAPAQASETVEVDVAVEKALTFVDEMLRSEVAQYQGGDEVVLVGGEELAEVVVEVPIVEYQRHLPLSFEDEFTLPNYNYRAVAEALAAAPLLSDEDRQFYEAIRVQALTAAEDIVSCLETCHCEANGSLTCLTHEQTPEGLYDKLSRCTAACRCEGGADSPVMTCNGGTGSEIMAYTAPVLPEVGGEMACGSACICMPDAVIACQQTPEGHYNKTSRCTAPTGGCSCNQAGYDPAVTCPDVLAYEQAVAPTSSSDSVCSEACLCAPDGTIVCAGPPFGFKDHTDACQPLCHCDNPGVEASVTCTPDEQAYEVVPIHPPTASTPEDVCSVACLCIPDGAIVCATPPYGYHDETGPCQTSCTCDNPGYDWALTCVPDHDAFEALPTEPPAFEAGAKCEDACICRADGSIVCSAAAIGYRDLTQATCKVDCHCDNQGYDSALTCTPNPPAFESLPEHPEPAAGEELCSEACICSPNGTEILCAGQPVGFWDRTAACQNDCTCVDPGHDDALSCVPDPPAYEELPSIPPKGEITSPCSDVCMCAANGSVICSNPPVGYHLEPTAKVKCTCVDPGYDTAISCSPDELCYEVDPVDPVPNEGVVNCSEVCTCTVRNELLCTPVVGKESLIYKCYDDCVCTKPGTSGVSCGRDPRINGCFVEGTLIKVGAEEYLPVERILPEHEVVDSKDRPRKVQRAVAGKERQKVIYLTTASGETLGVSEKHPMMTRAGLKLARELTALDFLLREDGSFVPIAKLERRSYQRRVFNLALEPLSSEVGDHLIVSEGLVTGDLGLQERLSAEPLPVAASKSGQ